MRQSLLFLRTDIEQLDFKIPDKSFYLLNASIINTWETQTRYFGDFTVLRNRTVQKIPILFILLVH